jgi:hypothetical protein
MPLTASVVTMVVFSSLTGVSLKSVILCPLRRTYNLIERDAIADESLSRLR